MAVVGDPRRVVVLDGTLVLGLVPFLVPGTGPSLHSAPSSSSGSSFSVFDPSARGPVDSSEPGDVASNGILVVGSDDGLVPGGSVALV